MIQIRSPNKIVNIPHSIETYEHTHTHTHTHTQIPKQLKSIILKKSTKNIHKKIKG